VLGAVYVYYFSGWLSPHGIRVVAQLRADPPSRKPRAQSDPTAAAGAYPVVFTLDRSCPLTSVAVFRTTDLEFEKDAAKPIWHWVADEKAKPVPVTGFHYGRPIRGMKPADPADAHAPPLLPGTMYRVVVDAQGTTGSADFQTRALPAP